MPYEVTRLIRIRALRKGYKQGGPSSQFVKSPSHRGYGHVDIKPNKHNSTVRLTQHFAVLVAGFRAVQALGLLPGGPIPRQMKQMIAGVTINGRRWTANTGCEFCLPGDDLQMGVGKIEYFCLLELDTHDEEDGLFAVVKEHEVVKRKRRVRYIKKKATRRVSIPVHCLTYALFFAESFGERPVQYPSENDEMFADRIGRPWPRNVRQIFAVPIAAAF